MYFILEQFVIFCLQGVLCLHEARITIIVRCFYFCPYCVFNVLSFQIITICDFRCEDLCADIDKNGTCFSS